MQDFFPDLTWAPGPAQPFLPAGELHIWRTRLAGDLGCPVAQEKARRLESQCFRRDIAARYGGELSMSLAECDGVALLAISRAVRQVGLDLERVREDIPFEEMAENFLDLRAQWDLRVTWSRQEKAWKFFRFWTSNEACSQVHPLSSPAETQTFQLRKCFPNEDFVAALAIDHGPAPALQFWDWLN